MTTLITNLEEENLNRIKVNYTYHENKTTLKAKDHLWIVPNTCGGHLCENIHLLEEDYLNGTLVKNCKIISNSKLDGIPTLSFPNIFVQSTFMRCYTMNTEQLKDYNIVTVLMDYFKTHKVCHNCSRCCGLCYNNKFESQYPLKTISELRTLLAYLLDREGLKNKIIKSANNSKSGLFRINANGEIHSIEMLNFWIEIARSCPQTVFYTYTKSFELFEEYLTENDLPENFIVNMSVIEGQEDRLSKYEKLYSGNKFKMVTEIPEDCTTVCTGNCSTCGRLCMNTQPKDNNTIYCKYHN